MDRGNSSPGPKVTTAQGTTNNASSNAHKKTIMMDRFLNETAKDGYFNGLSADRAAHEKDGGKAKL